MIFSVDAQGATTIARKLREHINIWVYRAPWHLDIEPL